MENVFGPSPVSVRRFRPGPATVAAGEYDDEDEERYQDVSHTYTVLLVPLKGLHEECLPVKRNARGSQFPKNVVTQL